MVKSVADFFELIGKNLVDDLAIVTLKKIGFNLEVKRFIWNQ